MSDMERSILDREIVEVDTEFGIIRCKVGKSEGAILTFSEYEDCNALAVREAYCGHI